MANVGEQGPAQPAALKRLLKKARFCTLCHGVFHDGFGHRNRGNKAGGKQHTLRLLSHGEAQELSAKWRTLQAGESKDAGEVRVAEERERAAASRADEEPVGAVVERTYRLTFGKHKGMTLQEIMAEQPTYLAWAIASDLLPRYPALEAALRIEGILEREKANAEVMKEKLSKRTLARQAECEAMVAAGVHVHADVVKFRKLQADRVLRERGGRSTAGCEVPHYSVPDQIEKAVA